MARNRRSRARRAFELSLAATLILCCLASSRNQNTAPRSDFDILIKNGAIVDGTGNPWYRADVGIKGDRIAEIGDLQHATAARVIDASGLVVSPGFIDMLGQSEIALLVDNRSLSKLSQGITTELTGEGSSVAPQNQKTASSLDIFNGHQLIKVDWTTLQQYFERLDKAGTPLNFGTYVSATQVRQAVLGDADREPTVAELEQMKSFVAKAMEDGAMGLSTALIYPPGHYAKTEELIELAKVAASYGGSYVTHLRSEGRSEDAALEEAFRIGREARVPVEIYHLKVTGITRRGSMVRVVAKIQAARAAGVDVAANQYPYVAGATTLASILPPWVAEGGTDRLIERLRNPAIRKRIRAELAIDQANWQNLYLDCGGPSGVVVNSVLNASLKKYEGKTVADIASSQRRDPIEAVLDLIVADNAQSNAIFFLAGETDLQLGLRQPWTSIGLDTNETSLDGSLYEPHIHPRAYGSMPRFLGHYVRDLHLLPLEEAIRKITSLPAQRMRLSHRGLLQPGYYADITIFDASKIKDWATYQEPNRLSTGVAYVLVNGTPVFSDGKITGATPGRILRGQGWRGSTP